MRARQAGQLSMRDAPGFRDSMQAAVGAMWLIEGSPAGTRADVKRQEELYNQLQQVLTRPHEQLANLATATHFGLQIEPGVWSGLAAYALARERDVANLFELQLAAADVLRQRWRFFHWELEFPEVFFDRQGQPLGEGAGFDVVIGNPPYVRQEELSPYKPYLSAAYPDTYHGAADLYVYFFNQGLRLTRAGGRMAYIDVF